MTMQRDKFEGIPIGVARSESFEYRMRRIRAEMLPAASLRTGADSPWFAVRVMSGREIAVYEALDEAGIEAVVPMRMGPEYRRRGRKIPASKIPVMTGYVLVRFFASDQAFLAIRGFEHVIDVVGGCMSPHRIPDSEVKRFKALADGGDLNWERPVTVFKRGEKVRVSDGPFASFSGEIISCRNDGKGDAVVEMHLFSGTVPVLMPLAILEKI
ncbi:transcription antitermination NusG domain-containing protein [Rhizobium sp. TAL182]|uniref:transcription termination/antitermination protein NusG n=1 Tax=Rhizobium sp. TAL182 TaxID=2020313 RepID=UPI000A210660|nr:transcription termination/antitermination NusG family protein [Rhizobium sp. TAL182]ARO22931.1 transcription antitermination NusG domain-containing protein [Rhizobium sp. TAL182]